MSKLSTALLILCLALPAGLWAAEETVVLGNGTSVKVLFFQPEAAQSPPLALLISSGSNNKFMARAQFWLGRELVRRGWAIAVPVSPGGRTYFAERPELITEIIASLRTGHDLKPGKTLLTGISSGGSSALAIAARHPEHYLGVVAAPGRVRNADSFKGLNGLPVYLRAGARDSFRWHRQLDTTVAVLEGAGAKVDAAIIPDGRHIFALDWDRLDAWLAGLGKAR